MNHEENKAPPEAYVKEGGCDVCDFQEEGKLHKWHCVFKHPYHYEDSDGREVHIAPPAPVRVLWESGDLRVLSDKTTQARIRGFWLDHGEPEVILLGQALAEALLR